MIDGWVNKNFINPSGRFPQEIALPAAANANNFYKCAKVQNAKNIYARKYVISTIISEDFEKLTFFACIKQ